MTSERTRHLPLPRLPSAQKPAAHEDMNSAVQRTPVSLADQTQGGLLVPKRMPLPGVSSLGTCPAKPKRPPQVNCDVFRRNELNTIESFPPPPPPPSQFLLINSVTPSSSVDFTFPAPPPQIDQLLLEDEYDDVMSPKRDKCSNDLQDSSGKTYEEVDSWPENNNKEPKDEPQTKEAKKKLKIDEKKNWEQEKKEKKAKERRELEARKKFKITAPVVVLATVTAKVDHKAGKNKLSLKQGETIEIVRKTGNPKNYWLARNRETQYGFVKPDTVEEFPGFGADNELNVSTDIDVYECPELSQEDFCFPPPPCSDDLVFNSEIGVMDGMFDAVSSSGLPPPPSSESIPTFRSSKVEEICPKKKKTFEKEEKDFRKKYKYNGEIRVLYQATVLSSLPVKRFGNKDLIVKPGETIDVIVHPAGDKVIGRNTEGKFGYVSSADLEEDSSVYEDAGQECIYDND